MNPDPLNPRTFRLLPPVWFVAGWAILLMYSMVWDVPARRLAMPIEHVIDTESSFWSFWKQIGETWMVIVVAIVLSCYHAWRWRAGVVLAIATLFAAGLSSLFKWIVGRERPDTWQPPFRFEPFRDGFAGFVDLKNLSMPSGHASTAFAMAFVLCLLVPRGRWAWLAVASMCGLERVLSLSHWTSDVVAAVLVGMVSARFSLWFCYLVTGQSVGPRRFAA
jgi:membrane-associated phospholipid phosphatase